MSDQKIDFTTHYAERIANNEVRLGEAEHKINDLSAIKDTLIVLSTIQKDMIEDNKIRDKERKESAKVMSDLSVSVKQTTDVVAKLNAKLDSTDKKLDNFISDRTENIEDKKNKKAFWTAIIGSILTSVAAIAVALLTR